PWRGAPCKGLGRRAEALQAGTWRVGDEPPFGRQVPGDSVLPVAL
ncbi:MAG: hypothetical protein JWR78_5438, partial [Mycobacterium sp.]|nr:hypothetical protein [Mycobacterium sp.]